MDTAALRLTLRANDPIEVPAFAGAMVRGGFGVAFKHVSCPLRRQPCETCLLAPSCVYQHIFETPVPEGCPLLPVGGKAPHPYVIEPPDGGRQVVAPGETCQVGLILIGRAIGQLPYFLYAFRRLGEMGLGRGRGRFVVEAADLTAPDGIPRPVYRDDDVNLATEPHGTALPTLPESPPAPPSAASETLTVHLPTPLRLKEGGRYGQRLTFPVLVKHLLRRLALLHACHGEGIPPWDHRAWLGAAEAIAVVEDATVWCDWERYSTRQRVSMRLGGWTGQVTFAGPWRPFAPLLHAGEIVHLGQGTTFGLGRIVIETSV